MTRKTSKTKKNWKTTKTLKTSTKNWKTTKTFKSPFAAMFINGIKKGTPCSMVINTIATKTKKTPTVIGQSLFKAGLVWRQNINNTWIFWAKNGKKTTTTNINTCTANTWQCFVDWCIACGICTPMQLAFKTGATKNFTKNCSMYVNKFWTASGVTGNWNTNTAGKTSAWNNTWTNNKKRSTTGRKTSKTHKAWKKTSWNTKWSNNGSYKFPMFKSRTTGKKYRHAA